MIYFEDLVIKAHDLLIKGRCSGLSDWGRNFVLNVGSKMINDENPRLSTNQAESMKKVLTYFVRYFVDDYPKEQIEQAIATPTYRNALYVSPAIKRECRHLGANFLGFRFKFNPNMAKDIQEKASSRYYRFDKNTKLWIVTVTSDNFEMVLSSIIENRFELDELTQKWIDECKKINSLAYEKRYSKIQYEQDSNCAIINVVANEKLEDFIIGFCDGVFI